MSCYMLMFLICTLDVALVILPILPLFKSDFICNPTLYLGLSVYCFLLNQHSLYCQLIVSMNEIPYSRGVSGINCCRSDVDLSAVRMDALGSLGPDTRASDSSIVLQQLALAPICV